MGIPCITTNVSGIDEVIHDKINGVLVSPGDEEKMVQAMDLLIQSPKLREEISIHGIETGKTFLLILFVRNGLRLYSIKLFMFYDNGYLK